MGCKWRAGARGQRGMKSVELRWRKGKTGKVERVHHGLHDE